MQTPLPALTSRCRRALQHLDARCRIVCSLGSLPLVIPLFTPVAAVQRARCIACTFRAGGTPAIGQRRLLRYGHDVLLLDTVLCGFAQDSWADKSVVVCPEMTRAWCVPGNARESALSLRGPRGQGEPKT